MTSVTQADREAFAALDICSGWFRNMKADKIAEFAREGLIDDNPLIQAFARHRQSYLLPDHTEMLDRIEAKLDEQHLARVGERAAITPSDEESVTVLPDPSHMPWETLREAISERFKDDDHEDDDLCVSRAEACSLLGWASHFDREAQPRRDDEEKSFSIIRRAAERLDFEYRPTEDMRENVAAIIRDHHKTIVRQPGNGILHRKTFHQGDMEAADAIIELLFGQQPPEKA